MNVIIKYGADLSDFDTGTDKVIKDLTKVESKGNDVTSTTNEFINTLKQGIAGVTTEKLTNDVDKLNKKLIEAGRDGKYTATELKNIGKTANDVGKELGNIAKNNDIKKLATETEGATKQFTSLKAELRALKQSISSGELQGKDLQLATLRAAQLTDELGDMQTKIRALASDTRVFDTMVEGARLATGAFGVAQGAVALFGDENEDLQKALIKLNAVMAISQGLQEISTLTQKQTAIGMALNTLATNIQTGAQTAYNVVVGTSVGVTKAFRLALAATGIGAVIFLLYELITNYEKISKVLGINNDKLKEQQKTYALLKTVQDEAINNSGKEIANIIRLGIAIKDQNLPQNERLKALKQYNALADDGNKISILQINNTDLVTKAIERQYKAILKSALALAASNKVNEIIASTLETRIKVEELKKKVSVNTVTDEEINKAVANLNAGEKVIALGIAFEQKISLNEAKKLFAIGKIRQNNDAIAKELTDGLKFIADKENEARIILENFGINSDETIEKATKGRTLKPNKIEIDPKLIKINADLSQILFLKKMEIEELQLEFKDIKVDVPDSQIQAMRTTFYEKLQLVFQNPDSNLFGDIPDAISEAAKLIDDSFAAQSFEGVLLGVSNLFDGITKEIDKIKTPLNSRTNEIAQGILQIGAAVTNMLGGLLDKQIENLDKLIDKQRDRVSKANDIAEEGNSKLLEAEENKLQRLETMRKKDGEKQKALAIVQAVINTALGITNAFATAPTIIAGVILAALTAAAGAVQIGLIASQTFAKGGELPMGLIDAPSHANGGAKFSIKGKKGYVGEYEGGEYIFNKETTSKNKRWFEYINKNKVNIDELFKSNQMANVGGITIEKSIELNELKNEISELKSIMRGLPERMPRTNVSMDSNGFALAVGQALSNQSTIKNNIHD